MKIAFVAAEAVPYAKTGGLADVAGSLPKELERLGCEVKLFIPKYLLIDEAEHDLHYNWDIGELPIRINNITRPAHVHQSTLLQMRFSSDTFLSKYTIELKILNYTQLKL